MAITHAAALRTKIADLVVDDVDIGTTNPNGRIIITNGTITLATIGLLNPAFGASVVGVATANLPMTDESNAAAGTASIFELQDRDNNVLLSGTVTATGGGGDVELDNINITAGSTVSLTAATYTAPI